jgi:hypothetical protein
VIVDWCVGLLDCLFGVEVMELMYEHWTLTTFLMQKKVY